MRIAEDTQTYLQHKLLDINLISPGSAYGISAMQKAKEDFAVVQLERETYSFYTYHVEGGRFRINNYEEHCPHNLFEDIPDGILENAETQKWHRCVFCTQNDSCYYDTEYDNLRIAEGSDLTFLEVLNKISSAMQNMRRSIDEPILFITGSYAENPLVRYVFQTFFSTDVKVKVLPLEVCNLDTINSEMGYVLPNQQRIDSLVLRINGGINLSFFVSSPAIVNVPVCMSDVEIANGQKWRKLFTDMTPDYRVGNVDYKYLNLQVEYDALGGIYLVGKDMSNNIKLIQL